MYRENMYDVMNATGEKITTLVIPKNSGLSYVGQVLREAGLDLDKAKKVEKDKMTLDGLTLVLERGEDVPRVVMDFSERGEVVLGVTGDDLYDEFGLENPDNPLRIENTYDWCDPKAKFGRPALCLINKTGRIEDIPLMAKVAINSKYLYTARQYLENGEISEGRTFKESKYKGNVEGRVAQGKDCGIEIVYSGGSLEEKELEIVDVVRLSDIVVISPLKSEESLIGQVFLREYATLLSRLQNPTGSDTSEMLKDPYRIGSRIAEESGEVVKALTREPPQRLIEETAQAEYTLLAALVKRGVSLEQLAKQMIKNQT